MFKAGKNSLFFKLVMTLVISVTLATTLTLSFALLEQGDRYIDTLSLSALRIIGKSQSEMRETGESIIETIRTLRSNWAFREYFSYTDKTLPEAVWTASSLSETVDSLMPGVGIKDGRMRLVAVGTNGVTYLTNHDSLSVPLDDLMTSDFTKAAQDDPAGIFYHFLPNGFTEATSGQSVFLAAAAVTHDFEEPYAYIYILMSQHQLKNYYRELSSEAIDFALIDENGTIISSLDDGIIGESATEMLAAALAAEEADKPYITASVDGRRMDVVSQPVKYWGLHLAGFIDGWRSDDMRSAFVFVLATSTIVAVVTLFVVSVILRRITTPLHDLVGHMGKLKSGDFSEQLPVAGEYEVRELTNAYNIMMEDINNYIRRLIETEDKKRDAEISALQMRIKPHFIYNTLTSIKWLVWRGETKNASASLEAFALLIKSMMSGDMLSTVREEVENLKHYVLLQQIRFGDQISVEFNIDDACLDLMLPKMIIQPFVENSFFHAYPDGQHGLINLFINVIGERLIAEIIDDGAGFPGSQFNRVPVAQLPEHGHKCGIGSTNADERIRLLFGEGFGITVSSEGGKGTAVKLTMPVIPAGAALAST